MRCRAARAMTALSGVVGMCIMLPVACQQCPEPLQFPFDHGPHFDAAVEWWYFTGEVQSDEGRKMGFEFTIFKARAGRNGQFGYIGHIAVSDPQTATHRYTEKVLPVVSDIQEGRAELRFDDFSFIFSSADAISLWAAGDEIALELELAPVFAPLPHGEDGRIVMGDGRRSYYYSYTSLATAGTLSIRGTDYRIVSGRTWMDHQWGDYTVFGMIWDWFSLRLEDDAALMLFRFRNVYGNQTRLNWTYRAADGSVHYGHEAALGAARTYTDDDSPSTYPVDWTIVIDKLRADFQVEPLFDAQSLANRMTPDYWEGLCRVEGSLNGAPTHGAAYAELTGYNDAMLRRKRLDLIDSPTAVGD